MALTSGEDVGSAPPNPGGPLRTREVFLDTEAYRRLGFDTAKPSIAALLGHTSEDRLQLHLTDITASEIRRQIAGEAQAAVEEIRRARATVASWRRRAPMNLGKNPKTLARLDQDAVADEAFRHFKNALRPFVEHQASRLDASDIFKAYFAREAPFDAQGGKSVKEFPDAFVIATLDAWCGENNSLMYVVTADKAMLRAATAKASLIPVQTLDALLEIVTVQHSPDVVTTVDTILEQPDFIEQLASALDRNLNDLVVDYHGDLNDGEASDPARSGDPAIVDWTVISAFDKGYGVIVEFDVGILVQVYFEDLTMASYDNEDGVFIGAEPGHVEVEEVVGLRMYIQVHENCSISRAELLTPEVSVYGPDENYS